MVAKREKEALRRNWQKLVAMLDQATRSAILLASDPATIARYARSFPEMFFRNKEESGPIPLSVLEAVASQALRRDGLMGACLRRNVCKNLGAALDTHPDLRVPIALSWQDESESAMSPEVAAIADQLVGKVLHSGMVVVYKGEEHVILCVDFVGDLDDQPCMGDTIDTRQQIDALVLVRACHIDLTKREPLLPFSIL